MKSLDRLPSGSRGIISKLNGQGKFMGRVSAMGFIPETEVKVIRNGHRGPLIVELRDTEVAIGRGEAAKITLKEVTV